MEQILIDLEQWRLSRNLDITQGFKFDKNKQTSFIISEIEEYFLADTEDKQVDALCDIAVFHINGSSLLPNADAYAFDYLNYSYQDSINVDIYDIIMLVGEKKYDVAIVWACFDMILNMGYDPIKSMKECIKHVSSREQDPIQKKEWELHGASGKWQKNKKQNPFTLYQPDYQSCKLIKE